MLQNRKFRPDIEGLRAIAVLAVVISHSKLGLESGFIGVDIFFVISGFLITSHLYKEAVQTNTISLKAFYARRIIRILPASIVVILLTILSSYFWLSPLQFLNYVMDGLWSTFSAMNYRLIGTSTDYFNSATIPSPLQHYWSLAIEEQFYLILPLFLLILTKLFSKKKYFKSLLSVLFSVIILVSLYFSYTVTKSEQTIAYFALHTRVWELAVGSLLAININFFGNIKPKISGAFSWLGILGLLAGFVLINQKTPFPDIWALIPVISTALIIAMNTNYNKFGSEVILGSKVFQWIGKISYSWYLVHFPLFIILLEYQEKTSFDDRLGTTLVSFIFANVLYFLVEVPTRFNPIFKDNIKNIYLFGLLLILICSGILGYLLYQKNTPPSNSPAVVIDSEVELAKNIKKSSELSIIPTDLVVPLSQSINDKYDGCISYKTQKIPDETTTCTLGNLESTKIMVLLGDSHAHQWTKTFENIAQKNNYKLITYTKSGCPISDITVNYDKDKNEYEQCYSWRNEAMSRIEQLKPDIIINTSLAYKSSNAKSYTEFIQKLKSYSKNVVILSDTPHPLYNIPECLQKNQKKVFKCDFDQTNATFEIEERVIELGIAKNLGALVIETGDWFCINKICPPIINKIIVYHDRSHISKAYSDFLTKYMEVKIASVL